MNQLIKANRVDFNNEEIINRLGKLEPTVNFSVKRLVYYPYYFFEYGLDKKSFIFPSNGLVACTIDLISGSGSLIDSEPVFEKFIVSKMDIIEDLVDTEKAEKEAQHFIFRTISLKMKIFKMPNINLTRQELFYRPYWIVQGNDKKGTFTLAVDGKSGKYHSL
ncbi:hypothetical protein NC797_07810 [Aquibacillus sp. 3ASR75-11]|uniref:Uncharacterized protein n=1 Tax=Terrihalobacillus insolitus TaxID=2950438 RepID=A0A9X3WR88_9BACI|nr:hypothetical protein [Terrihalobacillus insolitus]MDC3424412.1 hypothetical protein [Terrihalobacillus insolitus]